MILMQNFNCVCQSRNCIPYQHTNPFINKVYDDEKYDIIYEGIPNTKANKKINKHFRKIVKTDNIQA
jgi:hypothetical protein